MFTKQMNVLGLVLLDLKEKQTKKNKPMSETSHYSGSPNN